ncbi:hypothetical protein J6P92_02580 [bacterium]|nr:hypothetical protein [bacterium]
MWGAIAGAIAALGTGIASIIHQKRETKRNQKWQEDFWKKTYDQQLQDQLKHNSYEGQVNHLKSAGLNRNLAMSGGVTPYSAPTGATGDGSEAQTQRFDSPFNAVTQAQIDNLKADSEDKEASAKLKEVEAQEKGVQTETLKYLLEKLPQEWQIKYDNLRADFDKKLSDISVNDSKNAEIAKSIEEINKKIELYGQEILNMKSEKNLTDKQVEKLTWDMKIGECYLALEKNRVQLESIQTTLNGYDLELTAQGIKINHQDRLKELAVEKDWKEKLSKEIHRQTNAQIAKTIIDGVNQTIGTITDLIPTKSPKKVGF